MKLPSIGNYKDNLIFQVLLINKKNLIILIFTSLFASFSELIFLKDVTPFIEDILSGSSVNQIFILRQLILVFLWTFLGIFFRLRLAKLMAVIGSDMSKLLIANISKLSLKEVENLGRSKIITLSTQYLDDIINGICNPLLRLIEIILTILVGITVIFITLGLSAMPIILLGFSGLIFLIYITKSKSFQYGLTSSEMASKSVQTLNFYIDNIKEVILQRNSYEYSNRFNKSIFRKFFANGKAMFLGDLPRKILESLLYIIICLIGLFKFSEASNFYQKLPSLAVSLIVLQRIAPLFQSAYRSIFSIINLIPILGQYTFRGSFKEYKNIYLNKFKDYQEKDLILSKKLITSIEIKDLSIGHENIEIFQIRQLSIQRGKPLLILGNSGSGKTTFLETVIGLRPPISGSCDFFNKTKIIKDFRNISYVPQSLQLTGDTLFDMLSINNNLLKDYKNDKRIENLLMHILEICCIRNDFIKNLNDLHKPINEGASSLSGGQRQRICIARALLKNNSLVVLDEATSGLDKKMEEVIISNIVNHLQFKILVCVTHRRGLTKFFENVLDLTDKK